MITLDKYDSQIVLLAKGHFKHKNTEERDNLLKNIITHRNLMELKYISDESVFYALLQILEKLGLRDNLFHSYNFSRLLFGVHFLTRNSVMERWIDFCMGELSCLQVRDGDTILVQLEPLDLTSIIPL